MELYSPDPNESPSALGHMLQGIQHFGMTTPDLKKSLAFYVDILGGRLAVGGDGFYGSEMHNLLFQLDEMESKEGDHSPEYFGIPDLRNGKDNLDVRLSNLAIQIWNCCISAVRKQKQVHSLRIFSNQCLRAWASATFHTCHFTSNQTST